MNFKVEVEREQDGRWIAEVAELPGALHIKSNSYHPSPNPSPSPSPNSHGLRAGGHAGTGWGTGSGWGLCAKPLPGVFVYGDSVEQAQAKAQARRVLADRVGDSFAALPLGPIGPLPVL